MTFYLTLSSSVCGFSCTVFAFLKHLGILILVFGILLHSAGFCWYCLFRKQYSFHIVFRKNRGRADRMSQGLVFHMWVQPVTHGASPSHRPRLLRTVLAWKQTFHLVQIDVRIYIGWSCLCYSNHLTDHSSTLHAPSFPHLWIWVLPTGPPIFRNSSQFLIYKDFPFLFL